MPSHCKVSLNSALKPPSSPLEGVLWGSCRVCISIYTYAYVYIYIHICTFSHIRALAAIAQPARGPSVFDISIGIIPFSEGLFVTKIYVE